MQYRRKTDLHPDDVAPDDHVYSGPVIEACRVMMTGFNSRHDEFDKRYNPAPPFVDENGELPDWALDAMRADLLSLWPPTDDPTQPQELIYCSWQVGPYSLERISAERVHAQPGDYIVRDPTGFLFALSKYRFEQLFEPVNEAA